MEPERWRQIERLYYAVLEQEKSHRARYLEQSCAGDESLRREVESLLAGEETWTTLTSPPFTRLTSTRASPLLPCSFLEGQTLRECIARPVTPNPSPQGPQEAP
jgi:hypothetical protein